MNRAIELSQIKNIFFEIFILQPRFWGASCVRPRSSQLDSSGPGLSGLISWLQYMPLHQLSQERNAKNFKKPLVLWQKSHFTRFGKTCSFSKKLLDIILRFCYYFSVSLCISPQFSFDRREIRWGATFTALSSKDLFGIISPVLQESFSSNILRLIRQRCFFPMRA